MLSEMGSISSVVVWHLLSKASQALGHLWIKSQHPCAAQYYLCLDTSRWCWLLKATPQFSSSAALPLSSVISEARLFFLPWGCQRELYSPYFSSFSSCFLSRVKLSGPVKQVGFSHVVKLTFLVCACVGCVAGVSRCRMHGHTNSVRCTYGSSKSWHCEKQAFLNLYFSEKIKCAYNYCHHANWYQTNPAPPICMRAVAVMVRGDLCNCSL